MLVGDQAVPTHLSAFIDCHSRYVVEARYYLRENLDILIDSLLRAWAAHGASRELYLDNAKIYHAHALKAACFALNIRLLHRGVGDPPPGGLIERFFETAQGQLESEVRAGDILTLDRLNHALAAWLDVSYHQQRIRKRARRPRIAISTARVHPTRQPAGGAGVLPQAGRPHVDPQALRRATGRAASSGSDRRLRGDRVEVRYDPFARWKPCSCTRSTASTWARAVRYQRDSGPPGNAAAPQAANPSTITWTCSSTSTTSRCGNAPGYRLSPS